MLLSICLAGAAAALGAAVFGGGPACEEVFMAWHFARYTEAVAAAGRKEHALPMFANAALVRPGHQPGSTRAGPAGWCSPPGRTSSWSREWR